MVELTREAIADHCVCIPMRSIRPKRGSRAYNLIRGVAKSPLTELGEVVRMLEPCSTRIKESDWIPVVRGLTLLVGEANLVFELLDAALRIATYSRR